MVICHLHNTSNCPDSPLTIIFSHRENRCAGAIPPLQTAGARCNLVEVPRLLKPDSTAQCTSIPRSTHTHYHENTKPTPTTLSTPNPQPQVLAGHRHTALCPTASSRSLALSKIRVAIIIPCSAQEHSCPNTIPISNDCHRIVRRGTASVSSDMRDGSEGLSAVVGRTCAW